MIEEELEFCCFISIVSKEREREREREREKGREGKGEGKGSERERDGGEGMKGNKRRRLPWHFEVLSL